MYMCDNDHPAIILITGEVDQDPCPLCAATKRIAELEEQKAAILDCTITRLVAVRAFQAGDISLEELRRRLEERGA